MDESSRISFKLGKLSARFTHLQGPVVLRPLISANLRLNFNPRFFFFYSKAFSRVTFSVLSRSSNRHIVDKKNETEFPFFLSHLNSNFVLTPWVIPTQL